MTNIPSYKALSRHYGQCPENVKWYFGSLPEILKLHDPYPAALAYMFMNIEAAQITSLYMGIVKLHRADSALSWKALQKEYLTRETFKAYYKTVYSKTIPKDVINSFKSAEDCRDSLFHGKRPKEGLMRNAIADSLDYAVALNDLAVDSGVSGPFGDTRGFKGAGQSLDKNTTRWILKGMGFTFS